MGPKNKKLLEDIHPLLIIREVQKWPLLYASDNQDKAHPHFRSKLWKEISKVLFKDWDSLSDSEQDCKTRDLIKRWRNLRDTFKRQLAMEKKIREGCSIKRKTYVYFKDMLFLLPHVTTNMSEDPDDVILKPKVNAYFENQKKKKMLTRVKNKKSDSTIEEIDEDEHFFMSLIPSFKKMSEDEKLTAKMEILKVIKNIRINQANEYNVESDALSYNAAVGEFGEIKTEIISMELENASNDLELTRDDSSN